MASDIDGGEEGKRALVRSIIRLAQSLELEAVAEGIERPEQLDALRALGVRYGQGFLFAEPMEPSALAPLMRGFGSTPSVQPAAV